MILYVYVVRGSSSETLTDLREENIAVTGSAKKALERAGEYVAAAVEGSEYFLSKKDMSNFKRELKKGQVVITSKKTDVTATVKKFNLD